MAIASIMQPLFAISGRGKLSVYFGGLWHGACPGLKIYLLKSNIRLCLC